MAREAKTTKTARRTRKAAQALDASPAPRRRAKAQPANITETALDKPEIAARLEAATKTSDGKFDREKAIALAELNGLRLNPDLDNGRTAMVVRNAIRARALHGERVVWG